MAGYISFFNLDEWFTTEFTLEEQKFMEEKYSANSMSDTPLFFGNKTAVSNETPALFLSFLLMWFEKKDLYPISIKIAKKAESLFIEKNETFENMHFYYLGLIKFYYRNREIENNLETATKYCKKQIAISKETKAEMLSRENMQFCSLPTHIGFEQLAIIEKKNKNWQKVIELSTTAKDEGWSGEWDKRIEEAKKRLGQ